MRPGDRIDPHPVGPVYAATFSIGLNRGWRATDRGGITFADAPPGADRFTVTERWLPHLGDAMLLAHAPDSWHWVEPPSRERRTITGWWVTDGG
jgi:hypothetical protein